ncbi:MAG: oligosaccharide flippase family protein [Methylovulum sp.]|nr:oligosaccharide flippase family protein [Methylovulum sp.]
MIKKNIIANYFGQGWTALMGLAFVPLYIRYLGMESYGLIGLFAVMQAWLSLLDMGMSPTLNREMARFTSGAHSAQSIHNLLRSLEMICFSFAVLIALGVFSASGYLASDWLKADKLPTTVVAQALSVMAFVVALRFVEGIYRGSLFGLQRQVWYNSANAILATVRHAGAVAILAWVSPTIQTFFFWQAAISLLSIAVFARGVHRVLPKPPLPPKFSYTALTDVWRFARGMLGITFLAILLTQVDKVLLSRMLTLESFGYYTLAATVAGVLSTVIGPITDAIYPRMVELATEDDPATLVSIYHQGAQLVTILSASAVMLLSFFSGGIIFMWSGNINLAENTAPLLSVLAVGSFLNALMWMPYRCQLAHGWTGLTLKINLVAVIVLIPAIIWVVPQYGALGAAWIWVVLNTGYILISIHLMHRRLIPKEKWSWYLNDVLLPISGAIGVTLLAQQFQPASYQDRWHWFGFLLITGVIYIAVSATLANRIRPRLLMVVGRTFLWRFS